MMKWEYRSVSGLNPSGFSQQRGAREEQREVKREFEKKIIITIV